jgi:hypothetical protein
MALAIRFVPFIGHSLLYANGRSYLATGATVDIPFPDADAISGQATKLMIVGTTGDRPVNDPNRIGWPPQEMYDTTLSKPIFLVPNSSPAQWVDISGSAV